MCTKFDCYIFLRLKKLLLHSVIASAAMLTQLFSQSGLHAVVATSNVFTRTLRQTVSPAVTQTVNIKRLSFREPRANQLLKAIQRKDYPLAKKLVEVHKIHIDGHNKNENTALTDAAKRGDVEGIRFLIQQLHANPHASCDCPNHRTALHYAAKYGQVEVAKVLLELGADPSVEDGSGYTARDYTENWLQSQTYDQLQVCHLLDIYTLKNKQIK